VECSSVMSYLCRRMAQALQVSSGFVARSAASKAAGYMSLQRPWDAGIDCQKEQFRREWTAAWRK
jgi:hypothetical protein